MVYVKAILSRSQPESDERVGNGADANEFLDVRLPRTKPPAPLC
jgi:hypothetical protein